MSEKFIEGARTLRVLLYLGIALTVAIGAYMIISSIKSANTEVAMKIENLRLAKCQEIVVAKGTCNVKAEISQPLQIVGFNLPSFAPGSKSVSYNGPVTMRFGYDSTMPLFPEGTQFLRKGSGYEIIMPKFPQPKVLPDASARGFAHESTSYFTGDIPADTFYRYLDSLVLVGGTRTIAGNPNYFRDAYMTMVFELVRPLMGNTNFTITVGDLTYNEMLGRKRPGTEQNFIENIEGSKRL